MQRREGQVGIVDAWLRAEITSASPGGVAGLCLHQLGAEPALECLAGFFPSPQDTVAEQQVPAALLPQLHDRIVGWLLQAPGSCVLLCVRPFASTVGEPLHRLELGVLKGLL